MLSYNFHVKTVIREGRVTQLAIDEIKNWLVSNVVFEMPEEMIALFLMCRDSDITLTKETILAYFKIKNGAPEIFNDRDVDRKEVQQTLNVTAFVAIPTRMSNNTAVVFFKLYDTNYKHFHLVPSMKFALMTIEVCQRYDPPNKVVVVIDMKELSLMHLTCFHPISALQKFLTFLQEAMPLRIKAVHVLNTSLVFYQILALARVFIKRELMEMIKPHRPTLSMEEFHQEVPESCLPAEYGGTLGSVQELNRATLEQFREMKQFFAEEEELRSSYKCQ